MTPVNNSYSETYWSGEFSRTMFGAFSEEAKPIIEEVKAKFPWFREDECFSISTPAYHEVLQEPVVSACLGMPTTMALVGKNYVLSNRKFCMDSGTTFLRIYPAWSDPYPDFLPPGCNVMFKGENHAELGKPYNPLADTFYECYFSGDPETVEAHFNLPERRGQYETYYGVTVVNGQPARVKQYVYDEQCKFSDWDVIWFAHKKMLQRAGA